MKVTTTMTVYATVALSGLAWCPIYDKKGANHPIEPNDQMFNKAQSESGKVLRTKDMAPEAAPDQAVDPVTGAAQTGSDIVSAASDPQARAVVTQASQELTHKPANPVGTLVLGLGLLTLGFGFAFGIKKFADRAIPEGVAVKPKSFSGSEKL